MATSTTKAFNKGADAAQAAQMLRDCFPHGHPRFSAIVAELAELHSNKNFDYARGGDPLGNFLRGASNLGLRPVEFAWHLVYKQIDAVNWALLQGGEQKVESLRDKLRDIAVYSMLMMIMLEEEEQLAGPLIKYNPLPIAVGD